jgi:hypothetical protein
MMRGVPAKESFNRPDLLTEDRDTPDIRRIVAIHAEASQHREEARQLQAAGKIREARRWIRTAEELQSQLQALEAQVRISSRGAALKGKEEA